MSFAPAFRLPDRTSRTSIRRERPDRRGQWRGPAPGTGSVGCHPRQRLQLRLHGPFTEEDRREGAEYNYVPCQPPEGLEEQGLSVFSRDEDGAIFHTYSRYARANEDLLTATSSSTSSPRDVTKRASSGPCNGCG